MTPSSTRAPSATADPAEDEVLARLARYRHPGLAARMLASGSFATRADFDAAFAELKRFLYLAHRHGPMPMLSRDVDAVWHQFILFTADYDAFCRDVFGRFMHHRPNVPGDPRGHGRVVEFVEAYRARFGDLPALWGAAGASECNQGCGCQDCEG